MMHLRYQFVGACWAIFFVVWMVSALFTKRTASRRWQPWWVFGLLAAFIIVSRQRLPIRGSAMIWHASPRTAAAADLLCAVGLSIAIWARAVLGRNWSSIVALKEQQELVDRGPYAYVRHPIYTGVLLMLLASFVLWGRAGGVLWFGVVAIGVALKARAEERLLTEHFPDLYPRYRVRVKAAIIPFLI